MVCNHCGADNPENAAFCMSCGARLDGAMPCPQCGATVKAGSKFCPECGTPLSAARSETPSAESDSSSYDATSSTKNSEAVSKSPDPSAPARQTVDAAAREPFFTESRLHFIYKLTAIVPLAICALCSFLAFMFCFASVADAHDVLFGTGSASLGNVYALGSASSSAIIAFASIGLAVAAAGFLFLYIKQLTWCEIPRTSIAVNEVLPWLFHAVWIGLLGGACAICADVAKTDGGTGILSAGAGPICIIVFSVLSGLCALGVQIIRIYLAKKFPAFAEEERSARESLREKYAVKRKRPDAPQVPSETGEVLSRVRMIIKTRRFYFWACMALLVYLILGILYGILGSLSVLAASSIVLNIVFSIGIGACIIAGIASVYRKKTKLSKKDTSDPLEFLRSNRKNMIGMCTLACIVIVWYLVTMVIRFATDGTLTGIRNTLQVEGVPEYLENSLMFALFAVLLVGGALFIAASVSTVNACKKLPDTAAGNYERYKADRLALEKDLSTVPGLPRVRRGKIIFFTAAIADILIAAIAIGSVLGTNIFSEGKLKQIDMGASQYRVADILGSATVESTGEWDYFSDNIVGYMKRERELEEQLAKALLDGDENRIEEINAESEKLAAEAKETKYRTVRVIFDPINGGVIRIEMCDGTIGSNPSTPSDPRSAESVSLSPARISLEALLTGTAQITYTARFSDGDYVRAILGAAEVYSDASCEQKYATSIIESGTYYLRWTDSLGICTAALEVTA